VDQNVSSKQHFFTRFTYFNNLNLAVNPLGTGVCKCRCTETFSVKDVAYTELARLYAETGQPGQAAKVLAQQKRFGNGPGTSEDKDLLRMFPDSAQR
jgi:hypothetical protein